MIFFSITSLGAEIIQISMPEPTYHLCRFKSENHLIEHYVKINEEKKGLNCEYAIIVDDKLFKSYKADSLGCHDFIKNQINKGSVCINNQF
jgi:hypothetical protein